MYFKDLLNRSSHVSIESLAKVHQEPIQEHLANPLALHEVQAAIQAMKSNKSPGPDGIPAEIWKSREALAEQLHKLLAHIWEKEDVPQQFTDANVVTIYERDQEVTATITGESLCRPLQVKSSEKSC